MAAAVNEIALPKAVQSFETEIFQRCSLEPTTNLVISSLSLLIVLTMTLFGAKGRTACEMRNALKYSEIPSDKLLNDFENFMGLIKDEKTISIANKIYINQDCSIKRQFKEIAIKSFCSNIENIDFKNSKHAAAVINAWVESKTNHKIQNMIQPYMLNSFTRLILINAIYFKATWLKIFTKDLTEDKPFWINNKKSIDIPMMNHCEDHNYGVIPEVDGTALEMKYRNSSMSMIIVLPNRKDGYENTERKLAKIKIEDLLKKMKTKKVNVEIPRFRINSEIEFKDILSKIGMERIFTDSADFSNLLENNQHVSVSSVLQKTFIDVNEESTEAAAATAVIITKTAIMSPIFQFNANHPFYFCLYHQKSKSVIFSGRFMHPDENISV